MSRTLAALLGGAAGAVVLVGFLVILLWFCLSPNRSISRTSETGSSDPSLQAGRNIGIELSLSGTGALPSDSRDARCFMLDELALATKNFSDINLIGEGKFGEVYKGLLQDGMIVAIKKRAGAPSHDFIIEVRYLSSIRHRNLVNLLGYCQENGQQMLIYEYIPNGSISTHLYGAGHVSGEKLEFKNRLSIALGAAKGLAHLHLMSPPLVHKDFKTANVLVDENFIAKVADAGIRNLLGKVDVGGPSRQPIAEDIFLAPEVKEFGRFSDRSDIYSYGVFLLELVSGREAMDTHSSESDRSLVEWVADAGIRNLLGKVDVGGPSRQPIAEDIFLAPEVKEFGRFSDRSDIYSYGVFLLELVSGREAMDTHSSESDRSLVEWAQNYQDSSNIFGIIDHRLGSSFTAESMKEFIQLTTRCVDSSSQRRPPMNYLVSEVERILAKEVSLTTVMGEGTPTVTLGSQLFRPSR
ncbi:Nodulation receptor kinase [Thalictrum thalictroides]|uniref:non-specific serine/threonine protein kinase n=1 Tax=Thalictrum thalictroides TaxID=46969 RepID=A0A7J6V5A9_THATH|nr:Nodulation receptor kinase [Thalictrum thalictroides]